MPWKNSQEISRPDPDDKAEQADEVDGGELAKPILPKRLKLDSTPIEKKVRMKKMTRNMLASPTRQRELGADLGCRRQGNDQAEANVGTKPRMNLGKRSQISASLARSPRGVGLIWLVQI